MVTQPGERDNDGPLELAATFRDGGEAEISRLRLSSLAPFFSFFLFAFSNFKCRRRARKSQGGSEQDGKIERMLIMIQQKEEEHTWIANLGFSLIAL